MLNNLKSVVAIKTLAEANGVALTDDDMQTVEDQVDATIDQLGGYSAYVEALEAQYMTDEVYRQLMGERPAFKRAVRQAVRQRRRV